MGPAGAQRPGPDPDHTLAGVFPKPFLPIVMLTAGELDRIMV